MQLGALALATGLVATPTHAQTTITIESDEPIGTIQPEVYGQFLEHLGAQLYDGKRRVLNVSGTPSP